MLILRVTQPFADFAKGDEITDADDVATYSESHAAHVVRVMVDDPEPEAPVKPAKAPKPDAATDAAA